MRNCQLNVAFFGHCMLGKRFWETVFGRPFVGDREWDTFFFWGGRELFLERRFGKPFWEPLDNFKILFPQHRFSKSFFQIDMSHLTVSISFFTKIFLLR